MPDNIESNDVKGTAQYIFFNPYPTNVENRVSS